MLPRSVKEVVQRVFHYQTGRARDSLGNRLNVILAADTSWSCSAFTHFIFAKFGRRMIRSSNGSSKIVLVPAR